MSILTFLLVLGALFALSALNSRRKRQASIEYASQPNPEFRYCPLCQTDLRATDLAGKVRLSCPACRWVHWDNPKPVTITLVPLDGGLVLVKRKLNPGKGKWALPGGFIEGYEKPADGACREVFEETSLRIEIDRVVGAFGARPGINQVVLVFLAKEASGTPAAGDDAEDVRVARREDVGTLEIAFPLHQRAIEEFFKSNLSA